jgi:chromate reductase, NAD(P)H dehydrogenase (quinone)
MSVRILLVSGSLRARSTTGAALATARAFAPDGVDAVLFEGLGRLPHFNPDDDAEGATLHPPVVELRAALAGAGAVLFCTPEYAGALPGTFKNLLDWTVGGGETYGKAVAWINTSGPASPTGAADAHASLRTVLRYTGADIVEAACVRVPIARDAVGDDGLVTDVATRGQIVAALRALADYVRHAAPEG